jgi:hypothetical protein
MPILANPSFSPQNHCSLALFSRGIFYSIVKYLNSYLLPANLPLFFAFMGLAGTVLQVRLLYSGPPCLSIARAVFDVEKSAGRSLCNIHRRENGSLGLP